VVSQLPVVEANRGKRGRKTEKGLSGAVVRAKGLRGSGRVTLRRWSGWESIIWSDAKGRGVHGEKKNWGRRRV